MPSDLNGLHVLDLGCGWGQLSRELAGRGAAVTAVDLSGKLLERARDIERRHPVGIRYVHGDTTWMDWWDGTGYDGVVCNMALMDIDDLEAALRTVASVLRPSGWFNLSLLHPASRATQASTHCRAGLPTADMPLRDGGPPGRSACVVMSVLTTGCCRPT